MMKRLLIIPLLLLFLILSGISNRVAADPTPQPTACTTAAASSDPNATLCISAVDIEDTSASPNDSLVISWLSLTPQVGQVRLIDGTTVGDARGSAFKGTTHYVQLSNLQPNTSYQFDIVADGVVNNNGGSHWTTGNVGPAIPPPTTGLTTVLGRIRNPDGSDATEALVYVTIQHVDGTTSSLLSQGMAADDAGFFHVRLMARTPDNTARFSFDKTKDKVTITANSLSGFVSTTTPISNVLLSQNLALTLGAGYVVAATPTPSPLPLTSTPTPITPTATPTLFPATATAAAATQTAAAFTDTPTVTPRPPTATPVTLSATSTSLPTLTSQPITITPAQATVVAQASSADTPEPDNGTTTVRISPRLTATPASQGLADIAGGNGLLVILAVLAFGGAVVLALIAFWVWKR
ncbi:MAG: hypothetical protein WCF84_26205 [Anaerolineae bacterium]